jgi:hypothetical protein
LETKGKYISGKDSHFPLQSMKFWLFGLNYIHTTFSKLIRMVVLQATSLHCSGKRIPDIKSISLSYIKCYILSSASGEKTGSLLTFRHSFSKLSAYEIYELKNVRFSEYFRIIILKTNDSIYKSTGILKKIEESFTKMLNYISEDVVVLSLLESDNKIQIREIGW